MWYLVFLFITMLLFILPLIPAILEWQTKSDALPMNVSSTYQNDVRFFAKGFNSFLRSKFVEFMDGAREDYTKSVTGLLRKNERFNIIGESGRLELNPVEEQKRSISILTLSHFPIVLPSNMLFESEIYCSSTITTASDNIFRALLADGNIYFAENNKVLRWVHSDSSIEAARNCIFYGRISAERSIALAANTRFQRAHAHNVYFGDYKGGIVALSDKALLENNVTTMHHETVQQDPIPQSKGLRAVKAGNLAPHNVVNIAELATVIDHSAGRWLVDQAITLPDNCYFEGNLVSRGNVTIGKGSVIKGSIKSNETMTIHENVTINGSIVSGKNLNIGEACLIAGPVVAEELVTISKGSIIGTENFLTTISAQNIHVESGVLCYGTLWAREWGMCVQNIAELSAEQLN
jgi:predicted acyltransferase (DUF342 family)